MECVPDPVTNYVDAEAQYLRENLQPHERFYSRTLNRCDSYDFYQDVELLRGLSYFDIRIVPFSTEVVELSSGDNEYRIHAIEVRGTNNPDMSDPQVAQDYDDLSVALAGYIYDRVSHDKPFLKDICKQTQFVYGSYGSSGNKEFILVDLDLLAADDIEEAISELESLVSEFILPVASHHPGTRFTAPQMVNDVLGALSQEKDVVHLSSRIEKLSRSLKHLQ